MNPCSAPVTVESEQHLGDPPSLSSHGGCTSEGVWLCCTTAQLFIQLAQSILGLIYLPQEPNTEPQRTWEISQVSASATA